VYRIRDDTAPVVAAISGSVLGPKSSLSAERMASCVGCTKSAVPQKSVPTPTLLSRLM
jgi:hypothetical protein